MEKIRKSLELHERHGIGQGNRLDANEALQQYGELLETITTACRILLQNEDEVVDLIQEAIDMLWVYSNDKRSDAVSQDKGGE